MRDLQRLWDPNPLSYDGFIFIGGNTDINKQYMSTQKDLALPKKIILYIIQLSDRVYNVTFPA
jgi:hypothetical protein